MQPTSRCYTLAPPPPPPLPAPPSLPNNNNSNNKNKWDCPVFFFFYQLHRPHLSPRPRPIKLVKPHHPHCQSCSSNNLSALTFLHSTNNKYQEDNHDDEGYNNNNESCSHPYHKPSLFDEFSSSVELGTSINGDPAVQNGREAEIEGETGEVVIRKRRVLFTNMWWADVKAALGQRINVEGIVSSVSVFVKERHLALPHVSVPDIRYIDWVELQRRGFRGVVFDKDNTITVPYTLTLWGPLGSSMERCKSVFGNDIAVFSNSAGLAEYDHDGSKARALERAIGIKVLRHKLKKPAGTAEEIEKHFGCKSSQLIMVGDRPFTDVVYGNRNGFLTILTEPLSPTEEPFIVRQVRKLEMTLVNYWFRRGLKPTSHSLLPDALQCVKDPPSV